MTYQLSSTESAHEGVARVVLAEINAAIAEARDPSGELGASVHSVRKRCKKIRAALRLYRDALPTFERENRRFRDVGRWVAQLGDADVVIGTLELLADEAGTSIEDGWALAHELLLVRRSGIRERNGSGLERSADDLESARAQVSEWPREPGGRAELADGYERGYRRGRRGFRKVLRRPTVHRFHEWRKDVKYHWCHVCLLETASPGRLGRRQQRLWLLSEALGQEHDLAILEAALTEISLSTALDRDLRTALEGRRVRLRAEAVSLGHRLFASKPKRVGVAMRHRLEGWDEAALPEASDPSL